MADFVCTLVAGTGDHMDLVDHMKEEEEEANKALVHRVERKLPMSKG